MVAPETAGPARVLRPSDQWRPVGPPIPPADDPRMHRPRLTPGTNTHWHLPRSVPAQQGDVVLMREQMVRLDGELGPYHPVTVRLADYLDVDPVDLIADRTVWAAHVLTPDQIEWITKRHPRT